MYIHEHKKNRRYMRLDALAVLDFPRPCACAPISIAARTLIHAHAQDMYTEMQYPFSLSLCFSVLCVLARRGKHNDGERAKLRAFVRSFVRLGLVLETGDKEGVSTAAIMIALSASPTPLRRSLQPPRQCTPRVSMHMHRRHMHAKPRRRCALVAAFSQLQISCSFHPYRIVEHNTIDSSEEDASMNFYVFIFERMKMQGDAFQRTRYSLISRNLDLQHI